MKHVRADLDDRFAVLSDVHSNYPALQAVLDSIPDDINDIVFLGDVVGYAAEPARCLERVRDVADVILQGNHDRTVRSPNAYKQNPMAHAGLEHARDQLTDDQITWLDELPERVIVDDNLLFAHSHPNPAYNDRYVDPGEFSDLIPYFSEHNVDLIALGHTHIPHKMNAASYLRNEADGGRALNPGSVGQPRDRNPHAAYAIVDTSPKVPEATIYRIPYDVETAQQRIRDAGLPHRTANRLQPKR